jgi:hypothetical protein
MERGRETKKFAFGDSPNKKQPYYVILLRNMETGIMNFSIPIWKR